MQHNKNLRSGALLSLFVFFLMLIASIYFYSERMFFSDTSYMTFQIINKGSFQIEWFRFGAFITQLSILIGSKLGLSMRWILIAYSASFHIFYLFVAAVLFRSKAYKWVILYAFYWLIITTSTFFWPINDVHQGIAYLLLMFAGIIVTGKSRYGFLASIFFILTLGTTAIFCHPLVAAAYVFLWIYLIVDQSEWYYTARQTIILSVVSVIIIASKIYVSNNYAAYDSQKLQGVSGMEWNDIINTFSSRLSVELYDHMLSNYWLLPFIFFTGIFTLLWRKKYILAIWTIGCTLAYLVLICITFYEYEAFVIESELMTAIIITSAPFVFHTLPHLKGGYVFTILLFILVVRAIYFYGEWAYFTYREQNLGRMISKMKEKNLTKVALVNDQEFNKENWKHDWAFSAETALLSSSIWDRPLRHIALVNIRDTATMVPKNHQDVIGSFGILQIESINRKYFPFDTTSSYIILTYDELMK